MKWKINNISKELKEKYKKSLNINNDILASLLINNNINIQDANIIINNNYKGIKNPSLLTNSNKAADKIIEYLEDKNSLICIFGDYDVDGITSTKIIYSVLKKYSKGEVYNFIPERKDGYGINYEFCKNSIEYNRSNNKNILMVTVDNGINANDIIDYLNDNNIETVVLDHHIPNNNVPNCICVDPNAFLDGSEYLCGAGVAFKISQLISWHYGTGEEMLLLTPYVALGTIADIVPLSLENMCLIKYGLKIINSKYCPINLYQFKVYKQYKTLNSVDIGWTIAPIINACGRMNNISLVNKFIFSDDEKEANYLLSKMIELNDERKKITKSAIEEVEKIDFSNDKICIFDSSKFPGGIAGIIAGKITEKLNKPAVAIHGKDTLIGSARSIKGIDINKLFKKAYNNNLLIQEGGHELSAGLTIEKNKIKDFKTFINDNISEPLEQKEEILNIESIVQVCNINEKTFNILNEIPKSNNPLVLLEDIEIQSYRLSTKNPKNICIKIKDKNTKSKYNTREIWCWGMAETILDLINKENIKISFAGYIERNFLMPKYYTFKIKDIHIGGIR